MDSDSKIHWYEPESLPISEPSCKGPYPAEVASLHADLAVDCASQEVL